ncbi:hypothetical protein [Desulfomicrobium apsheronum]|uniref:hypothetical protein n=1 Tax=Desulfomicrobium apsheronum TaxID=52560 RepID=UPI0011601EB6|nr:hypothetical protein [Desulfomicrobium apsheronum]
MLKHILILIIFCFPINVFAEEANYIVINQGSESRCMSALSNDKFCEDDYKGNYYLGTGDCVTIEDDRVNSGHLILRADCLGLHCPLYRFSKYIYVYGKNPDSPEPVLGTVTFLSDGSRINQMIWLHDSKQSFFPLRK